MLSKKLCHKFCVLMILMYFNTLHDITYAFTLHSDQRLLYTT